MKRDGLAVIAAVAVAVLVAAAAQSPLIARLASSVAGSAAGMAVPPLDDPLAIRRAAGHYDRVCARCHGSPERPRAAAAIAAGLSPSPPLLRDRVKAFPPEQLFQTIRHGIPGTGMPAWPVHGRDDEVWAMVAFLKRMPELDAATYRALAGVAAAASGAPFAACARCHGADGAGSADGAFPRLDIQSPAYLFATLRAFRDGGRASGFMHSVVAGLGDAELMAAAEHFGGATPAGAAQPPPDLPAGPACPACHGPPAPARPGFPSLSGQHLPYLLQQFALLARREHPRGGTAFVHLMHEVAQQTRRKEAAEWLAWFSAQ